LRKKTTKSHFDLASSLTNGSNSRSKVGRIKRKGMGNTSASLKSKKRSWAKLEAKSIVHERGILLDLPIRTKSEANCFEPWRIKHGRHKEQQRIVAVYLKPLRDKIQLPCKIMLTRFAPDSLDNFDNLPMSFKYIVDAICAIITGEYRAGKADSDKRISISCDQVKSKEYGIRIEVTY
jgi:hypothetical protein